MSQMDPNKSQLMLFLYGRYGICKQSISRNLPFQFQLNQSMHSPGFMMSIVWMKLSISFVMLDAVNVGCATVTISNCRLYSIITLPFLKYRLIRKILNLKKLHGAGNLVPCKIPFVIIWNKIMHNYEMTSHIA